jgi:hypothetical protein
MSLIVPPNGLSKPPKTRVDTIGSLKLQYIDEPIVVGVQVAQLVQNNSLNVSALCNELTDVKTTLHALLREMVETRSRLEALEARLAPANTDDN